MASPRSFGPATTIGVFHYAASSLAALSHAQRVAAAGLGKRWDALCLFDPPMMAAEVSCVAARRGGRIRKRCPSRASRRTAVVRRTRGLGDAVSKERKSFARWVPEGADLFRAPHTAPDAGRTNGRCAARPPMKRAYSRKTRDLLFEGLPEGPRCRW